MNKTFIQDTAYGGYGVGKLEDGRVVFIPHTVQGDTVTFRVTEDKSKFVYGELIDVVEPSAMRGELYCPHIGSCGGCVFGHINYDDQLRMKKGFVKSAFDRNKLTYPEPEITGCDFREFRNRATFRVKGGRIGFYKFKSNDFIPVDECPVVKRSIVEKAKEFAASTDEDCSIYVTENEKGDALGRTEIDAGGKGSFYGLKNGERIIGERYIGYDTPYGMFYANFSSFLQGNRHLSVNLQDFVYENASGAKALELYCGAGFLTLPLAQKCAHVDAVESYVPAVKLAERAGIKNVRWHVSMSEQIIRRLDNKYDVIVADPPRTGMDKSVCRFIKESGAAKVILISCDPNTLARDIFRLSGVYEIKKLQLLDMFPGSYHVESLALLNKVK